MLARKVLFGLVGFSLALLSACGRPQNAQRPPYRAWPNGTAQVSYTQYGLTDTYVYGRTDLNGKEYGITCEGLKNEIRIEFSESKPNRQKGETHLTIVGNHPDGASSKPSDLPSASFKLRNWPPNGGQRKADTYEQSTGTAPCKLNYRKEGHRGIGTFDCSGLQSFSVFERALREHPLEAAFAPEPIRVHGDFNCYVFEDEEPTGGELSAPPKDPNFKERDCGQRNDQHRPTGICT